MSVADSSITSNRQKIVDFTVPYMNTGMLHLQIWAGQRCRSRIIGLHFAGVSIMYARQKKKKPWILAFLNPLSLTVWLSIGLAFVTVSLTLCLSSKISTGSLLLHLNSRNIRRKLPLPSLPNTHISSVTLINTMFEVKYSKP